MLATRSSLAVLDYGAPPFRPFTLVAPLAPRRAARFLGGRPSKAMRPFQTAQGFVFFGVAGSRLRCLHGPPLFRWRWRAMVHSYRGCPLGVGMQTLLVLKVNQCNPCARGLRATRRPAASVDSEIRFGLVWDIQKHRSVAGGLARRCNARVAPSLLCISEQQR